MQRAPGSKSHGGRVRTFHRRRLRCTAIRRLFDHHHGAAPARCWRRSRRAPPPTSTPRSPPRARHSERWAALRGHERARHLYALARHAAAVTPGCSRCWKRSTTASRSARPRDHRHAARRPAFLSSRRLGLADRARTGRTGPVGVCRADHSVEFSAADAGLEDRAGAGRRQYRGAEARRIHPADRARSSPKSAVETGLPPGVVNIVTGDGATGAALVDACRRRQDRLHRLDRGRPR